MKTKTLEQYAVASLHPFRRFSFDFVAQVSTLGAMSVTLILNYCHISFRMLDFLLFIHLAKA